MHVYMLSMSVLCAKWKYCLNLAVLRMVCNSGEFLKTLSSVWDSTPLFFFTV